MKVNTSMKITKKALKEMIVEEYKILLSELNACHSKTTGKLSSCASGDSYSLSEPAVKKAGWDSEKAGKGKITSKGNPSYRFGMASGEKACGRKTVPGKKINPKYKCADYPEQYDESGHPLVPSSEDADSDRKEKLGYTKNLQALGRGVIRADETLVVHGEKRLSLTLSELMDIIGEAFQDLNMMQTEAFAGEKQRAFQAKCRQMGFTTPAEAQKAILTALNNFHRASDGKLFEPVKK